MEAQNCQGCGKATTSPYCSARCRILRWNVDASERGCLPMLTKTTHGVIVDVSLTAYKMAGGQWVSFDAVHGAPKPVSPLVVLS